MQNTLIISLFNYLFHGVAVLHEFVLSDKLAHQSQ